MESVSLAFLIQFLLRKNFFFLLKKFWIFLIRKLFRLFEWQRFQGGKCVWIFCTKLPRAKSKFQIQNRFFQKEFLKSAIFLKVLVENFHLTLGGLIVLRLAYRDFLRILKISAKRRTISPRRVNMLLSYAIF